MVHLNLTAPGNVVCSVYAPTIKPAFTERRVKHAGHARVFIAGLQEDSAYSVQCSLSVNDSPSSVSSNTASFTTQRHTASHIAITDVEAFSSFARVHVKSDTPGTVMCFPHRKHFGEMSMHSFRRFAELVPADGHVVANWDDAGVRETLEGYTGSLFTFSERGADAHCHAENLVYTNGLPSFDVICMGQKYAHVALEVGGEHNVMNALAAASAAYVLGIRGEAVERGLATFTGAGRRFEKKGSYHGADVYDDYAHHPGELHALLTMAKALPYRRIVCAFQPHTYTRTKALFEEFVRELKLPDVLILAEIYAAREQNDIGISSNDLARRIPGAIYCPTLDKVTEALRAAAQPGDLIITVGAGDIYKAGEKLLREN